MSAATRAATDAGLPVGESAARLVQVCARQADELAAQAEAARRAVAAQLRAIEAGRSADAIGAGCWVTATLRVLAGSLGELHTVLDEAAHQAHYETTAAMGRPRVPRPRTPEPDPDGGDVVAAAVEELHGLRHRLGPDALRSLAGIWTCAQAAQFGGDHVSECEIEAQGQGDRGRRDEDQDDEHEDGEGA